jgi:hypothetical protein
MHDELLESEAYYDPSHDPEEVENMERAKAKEALEAPAAVLPADRRKLLLRISQDTSESYSRRMDARRLLEIADLREKDFEREFRDFMAWNDTPRAA